MEILPTINGDPVLALENGRFGGRGGTHKGLDLKGEIGDPVYAMFGGTVVYNINHYDPNLPYNQYSTVYGKEAAENYNAGNRVQIQYDIYAPPPPDHDTIITTPPVTPPPVGLYQINVKYMHLNRTNITGTGKRVKAGDIIGYVGKTGSAGAPASNGPHLHLEVFINGSSQQVDPEQYLYTSFGADGVPYRDCF